MFESVLENFVTEMESQIKKALPDEGNRELLSRELDLSFDEWAVWQDVKSHAQANGWIDVENAMYIYTALGGGPESFNRQPVQVKATLTYFMETLMARTRSNG